MARKFADVSITQDIVHQLIKKTKITDLLLKHLVPRMKIGKYTPVLADKMTPLQIEEFVFSAPQSFRTDNAEFRNLLENASIFVQRMEGEAGEPQFCVAVSAISLLQWIEDTIPTAHRTPERRWWERLFGAPFGSDPGPRPAVSSETPRTDAAHLLLQDLMEETPSLWWERLVEFTLVSRSFKRKLPLEEVFGISANPLGASKGPYNLTINVAEVGAGYRALPDVSQRGPGKNVLTVYRSDKQSGFDGHVVIFDEQRRDKRPTHFYLQMKIKSTQGSLAEILARAFPFTLLNHIWRYGKESVKRGEVHFVLYSWGLGRGNISPVFVATDMKNDVMHRWAPVSPDDRSDRPPCKRVANWAKAGGKGVPGGFDELVRDFTEKYFTTNVHVVDGNVLDDWLLPSFLPFPMMFTALGLD
jgi:hypothetical protein